MAVVNPAIDPLQADQSAADAWRGGRTRAAEEGKTLYVQACPGQLVAA